MNNDKKLVCKIILKDNSEIIGEVSKEQLRNNEWILIENACLSVGVVNKIQSITHKNDIQKILIFKKFRPYNLNFNYNLDNSFSSKIEEYT
jgi:hypothetical protein